MFDLASLLQPTQPILSVKSQDCNESSQNDEVNKKLDQKSKTNGHVSVTTENQENVHISVTSKNEENTQKNVNANTKSMSSTTSSLVGNITRDVSQHFVKATPRDVGGNVRPSLAAPTLRLPSLAGVKWVVPPVANPRPVPAAFPANTFDHLPAAVATTMSGAPTTLADISAGQMPAIPNMEKEETMGVAPFDAVVDGSVAPSAAKGGSTPPAGVGGTPAGGTDTTQLDPRPKAPLLTPATELTFALAVRAAGLTDQTGLVRVATKTLAVQGGANKASLEPCNVHFNVHSFLYFAATPFLSKSRCSIFYQFSCILITR